MTISQEHVLKCGLWTLTITFLFVQLLFSVAGAVAFSVIAAMATQSESFYILGTIGSNAFVIDIIVIAELVSFVTVVIAAIRSNSEIYIGYQIIITCLINLHIAVFLTVIPVFYSSIELSFMFIIVYISIAGLAISIAVALLIVSYNSYYESHDLGIPKLTKKNMKRIIRAKWSVGFIYSIAIVQFLSLLGGIIVATVLVARTSVFSEVIPYFVTAWVLMVIGFIGLMLLPISMFFFSPTTSTYHIIMVNLMFFFSADYAYFTTSALRHMNVLIIASVFLVVHLVPLGSSLIVLLFKLGRASNISLTHPFKKKKPPQVQAPQAPPQLVHKPPQLHEDDSMIVISTSSSSSYQREHGFI